MRATATAGEVLTAATRGGKRQPATIGGRPAEAAYIRARCEFEEADRRLGAQLDAAEVDEVLRAGDRVANAGRAKSDAAKVDAALAWMDREMASGRRG